MKVKLITTKDESLFTKQLNEFVGDRDIMIKDIKFSTSHNGFRDVEYSALVMYTDAH